jgi:hypothetical protein
MPNPREELHSSFLSVKRSARVVAASGAKNYAETLSFMSCEDGLLVCAAWRLPRAPKMVLAMADDERAREVARLIVEALRLSDTCRLATVHYLLGLAAQRRRERLALLYRTLLCRPASRHCAGVTRFRSEPKSQARGKTMNNLRMVDISYIEGHWLVPAPRLRVVRSSNNARSPCIVAALISS